MLSKSREHLFFKKLIDPPQIPVYFPSDLKFQRDEKINHFEIKETPSKATISRDNFS